jgi:hypothetical protein
MAVWELQATDIGASAALTMDGTAPNSVDNTGGSLWETKNTNTDLLRDDDGAGTNGITASGSNDHELLTIGNAEQRAVITVNCQNSANVGAGVWVLLGFDNKAIDAGDGYVLKFAPNAAQPVKVYPYVAGVVGSLMNTDLGNSFLTNVDVTLICDLEDMGGGTWRVSWDIDDGTTQEISSESGATVTPGTKGGLYIPQSVANGGFVSDISLYTIAASTVSVAGLLNQNQMLGC